MKRYLIVLICSILPTLMMSQVPAAFSYQAVLRNSSGEVIANKDVSLQISILQTSESGTPVYVEEHSETTNEFGLVNLAIGTGVVQSGVFDPGGWGSEKHFLKVELDPEGGSAYVHFGTTQLLSVPYAFHAQTVEEEGDGDPANEIQNLSIVGSDLSLSNGGGTVTLPSGDNWGSDYVHTDATLTGLGTNADPLKLAQQSAASGQTLKWNGSTWTPANDLLGSNPWLADGSDIYYNSGWVGIGTSNVTHPLSIENANNTCYINLKDNQGSGGMRMGAYIGELALINDNLDKNIIFTVRNSSGYNRLMTLDASNDRVGINTTTPDATLDVEGTVVVGASGKIFSEIREITGTTNASGGYTYIDYPSGYTMSNIRILSLDINYNGAAWIGVGSSYSNTETPRVFYYMDSTRIWIYYPTDPRFQSRAFRILVMKVQ